MPKAKSPLEQSLEDDMKAAGLTHEDLAAFESGVNDHQTTGDDDHDDEDEDTGLEGDDEDEIDTKSAADRLAARRAGRKPADDEDDAGGSSQDDGGDARGSDGSPSDSGKGAQKNGEALPGEVDDQSPSAMARMRRELREAQAKIKELSNPSSKMVDAAAEAAKAPAATPGTGPSEAVAAKAHARTLEELGAEPDKDEDLAAYLVYNTERNKIIIEEMQNEAKQQRAHTFFRQALDEVKQIETEYTKTQPDYGQAIAHAEREYRRSLKVLMPHVTDAQINQALDKERINLAIKCDREGTNVAEVMYDLAIERFGYDPEKASAGREDARGGDTPPAQRQKAPVKPDLRTVAKNRARSATPLDGGGRSSGPRITLEEVAGMTPLEIAALPPEDLAYLESIGF